MQLLELEELLFYSVFLHWVGLNKDVLMWYYLL